MDIPYRNRSQAGKDLAARLTQYANRSDVIVLALPRGGVPVAYEVATRLNVPLDVFLVRKLGVPGHEELAMGAIASGGIRVINRDVVKALHIHERTLLEATWREQRELLRRDELYRGGLPAPDVTGRTVILVDDGLATGSTMRAAVAALRQQRPARILVAVPVSAVDTCAEFETEVDEIICARKPSPFYAVGAWYEDFSQTTDEEIRALLAQARNRQPAASRAG